jgi:glc operon protein GlcG
MKKLSGLMAVLVSVALSSAHAQAPAAAPAAAAPAPNYGPNITLEQAKTVLAAAEAEAVKQKWTVAIAIVDTAGNLVAFEKLNNTQFASTQVAQDKAFTAVAFKRPTKALQDTVAGGGAGLRMLSIDSVTAVEGGTPLVVGGQIVGAIGISGMASDQDSVVANAGAAALK